MTRYKGSFPVRDREYTALAEFRYQMRRFLHFSEEAARRAGVHPQQHQLLLAIRGLPSGQEARIGKLAERLQLEPHSAVELINRAERRGLVMRTGNLGDRRQVIVHITHAGEAVLKKLSRQHRAELQSAAPQLLKVLKALGKSH
ncbi:MAG TPA: MarR family transcriptional regulator [Terriglobales bacterium]|nr:MarR family transcriptional regulator [Terriglobales bacterium]